MKTRSMKNRRKTSKAMMDVETEFYGYKNNGVVLRSQPKQKNHTSHVAYPTKIRYVFYTHNVTTHILWLVMSILNLLFLKSLSGQK